MEELLIQKLFEKFLSSSGIKFKRECKIKRYVIDFLFEKDGKIYGAEVKSNHSNVFRAIGQLLVLSNHISNIYLVAPEEFYKRIRDILEKKSFA